LWVAGVRYYVIGEQTEPLTPNKIIRALENPKHSHDLMHTFCSANTLPFPLLDNSRDRFNAFSSIVFYVCMFEHLCETFKLSASCICGRTSSSDEEEE